MSKEAIKKESATIQPLNFRTAEFVVVGTAPYVMNKFSTKAREKMREAQEAGSQGRKGKKREPKDFEQCYRDAMYMSADGWAGIPASQFRAAMIAACRVVGFKMTHAKLALFVEPDGFDTEGTGLVKISKGEPHYNEGLVRNESGVCDIRPRPMWNPGWEASVRVRFDADLFSLSDVANLLTRGGLQCGIGEGRPNSRDSNGCGWGTFEPKQG